MPFHFAARLLLSVLMAVLPFLGMEMSRRIYRFVDAASRSDPPIRNLVFPLAMYAFYLIATKAYLIYYQRVVVQFGAILTFEKKVKLALHKKCGEIEMRCYEAPQFYDGLWEAKVASMNIYRVVECLIEFCSIIISIFVLSGYAASIHPLFFLFVLFTAFPSLTEQVCEGVLRSRRQRESAAAEKEESARWDGLVNHASAKERILFDCYPFLKKKWKETSDRYQETEYSVGAYVFKVNLVLSVFRFGALAGVYVLAGLLYFQGKVDYAGFITTISTALFLQSQYGELFEVAGYYTEFVNLVKPFFRFMEADEEKKETGPSPDREIRLEHVAFAYPTSEKNVLNDISLTVQAGERIAIVGVNGAGKSTLAKILSGLLQPTCGNAFGCGKDFTRVMFQDFQRYALSREENIAVSERIPQNMALIHRLSRQIELEDIPSGEILGREFGETDLSGGQWQKIALARLFYHGGNVLLLDEPTAAIDPLYEKRINELILENAATENTSLIVISHRLSIARLVDRIYVLNDGRIVEGGTHDELLHTPSSLYRRLWDAQTSWYR